ncbi:hypothetical protein NL676_029633 [Syzygium grande]|nr:hypothetical protein NL676_029633 [Syzygium grande]
MLDTATLRLTPSLPPRLLRRFTCRGRTRYPSARVTAGLTLHACCLAFAGTEHRPSSLDWVWLGHLI